MASDTANRQTTLWRGALLLPAAIGVFLGLAAIITFVIPISSQILLPAELLQRLFNGGFVAFAVVPAFLFAFSVFLAFRLDPSASHRKIARWIAAELLFFLACFTGGALIYGYYAISSTRPAPGALWIFLGAFTGIPLLTGLWMIISAALKPPAASARASRDQANDDFPIKFQIAMDKRQEQARIPEAALESSIESRRDG